MKFLSLGILFFAFTFCGLSEKLKEVSGGSNSNTSTASNSSSPANSGSSTTGSPNAEKASPTAAQQSIIDAGTETKWDDQGLSWKLPAGWKKMDVKPESFNYMSPDNAFLLVNISSFADSFPMDISLSGAYTQAMDQLRNGKYESAKMVEIDGIKGVEFVEAPPPGKDDPRRHQFIAYRRYLGKVQMVNVMTSTKGSNFDKHKDDFTAILYSMKAVK